METVLVVGATGNIGVSVVTAALRSNKQVLAVVRNQDSANKLFQHVGTKNGITTVEADVLSENGVQGVVDQVKAGKVPAFQHVYATVGILELKSPIQDLDMATFRKVMNTNLAANFFAYRSTVPYLIEQNNPKATWTLMTGAAGDVGWAGVTAISQGALFSMANVACLENEKTNIRFNEVYLGIRIDYDSVCDEKGTGGDWHRTKASDFAKVQESIWANEDIQACRVSVLKPADIDTLQYKKKLSGAFPSADPPL